MPRTILFSILLFSLFLNNCANQNSSSSNSSSSSTSTNENDTGNDDGDGDNGGGDDGGISNDKTAPELVEIQSVRNPTNNTTPSYSFSSTEKGTISYGNYI